MWNLLNICARRNKLPRLSATQIAVRQEAHKEEGEKKSKEGKTKGKKKVRNE